MKDMTPNEEAARDILNTIIPNGMSVTQGVNHYRSAGGRIPELTHVECEDIATNYGIHWHELARAFPHPADSYSKEEIREALSVSLLGSR
tara:strand:+ start:95 stop:364 length:270 start_codon:yes stop_codon:yes gene_type:complete